EATLVVPIVPKGVRDLLEEDDDTDACQHAFDDGRRKIVGEHTGARETHPDLKKPCEYDRAQEELQVAQVRDGVEYNDGQASRRSTDTERGAGDGRHNDATDDARDHSTEGG